MERQIIAHQLRSSSADRADDLQPASLFTKLVFPIMKKTFIPLAAATLLLSLTACRKPVAQEESAEPESTPTPSSKVASVPSSPTPAATTSETAPAPTPATPTSTPIAAELAPPGVFYLIEAARIETDSGLTGLPPGTGVKLLHDDVYLTPAGEARLRAEQLTNDMTRARKALAAEKASQNAAQARIAADSAIIAERARVEAQSTPQPVPATASAAAFPPVATPTPLGSSLSRTVDPLNTTHSSTKDKVFTDPQGRKYWKDIYGHAHYF